MLGFCAIRAALLWGVTLPVTATAVPLPASLAQSSRMQESSPLNAEPDPVFEPMLQNPVLRDYFRQMYLRTPREVMMNDQFVEAIIDSQVAQFLRAVDLQLGEVVAEVEVAGRLQERRNRNHDPAGAVQLKRALQASLKRLGDRCDSLGDRLGPVFLGLDRSAKKASANAVDRSFGERLETIGVLVKDAEKQIRDYLFNSTNLVQLDDLSDRNMLVLLEEAEAEARSLQRQLN